MSIERNRFPEDPVVGYEKLRPKIQTGDVVLFSGTGKFSRAIQKTTRSVWSHVGLVLVSKELGRVFLCESLEPHGVRMVRLSAGMGDAGVVVLRHKDFPSNFQHAHRVYGQYATDLLGKEYDMSEIGRQARNNIRQLLGLDPMPYRVNDKYICSEYVAACQLAIGLEANPDMDGTAITPADFANPNYELVGVLQRTERD